MPFESQLPKLVPEVLSSCRLIDTTSSILDAVFVSLSCVIENAVSEEFRRAPLSVKYNERNNTAVMNDQGATHVSITETTLHFQWGGDAKYNLRIDRLSGRFQTGNAQFPVLATGRCNSVKKRRF